MEAIGRMFMNSYFEIDFYIAILVNMFLNDCYAIFNCKLNVLSLFMLSDWDSGRTFEVD